MPNTAQPPYTRSETPTGVEYEILSSNGKHYYTVVLLGGKGAGCECKSAQFHATCKHQQQAERLEREQPNSAHEKRLHAPLTRTSPRFSLLK